MTRSRMTDKQHADHQFRIDRRRAGVAVKRLQRGADAVEIKMMVNATQLMIGRHVVIKAKVIKQSCRSRSNAHHRRIPRKSAEEVNHAIHRTAMIEFFNTIGSEETVRMPA